MSENRTADALLRDTVIRVNLSAIAQNMKNICALVGQDVAVAAKAAVAVPAAKKR